MPDPRPEHRRARSAAVPDGDSKQGSGATRFQQVASWLLIVFIVLTVLGFVGALLYSAYHQTNEFFSSSLWQIAYVLPLVCLPLAAVTLVAIVVSAARQKSLQRR
ncbi:hypothetical protein [uncultured Agrococcus sp.]|uniref:hypothetical protein n=1 Tax=uncultured Agrococcus sp. TaxID=382258 RepID=UPI0025F28FA7|nr:hypothetical protein [uncultured Agrococcus sp.]